MKVRRGRANQLIEIGERLEREYAEQFLETCLLYTSQFDPEVHNAVMQVEEEGFETNQIVEVLQKGYSLNGKVLRHSMVKVAK